MPALSTLRLAVAAAAAAAIALSLSASGADAAVVAPVTSAPGLRASASASTKGPATGAPPPNTNATDAAATATTDNANAERMRNFTYGTDSSKDCTAAYESAFASVDRDADDFASQLEAALAALPDGTKGSIDCRDQMLYKYKPPALPTEVGSGYGVNSATGGSPVLVWLWLSFSSFSSFFAFAFAPSPLSLLSALLSPSLLLFILPFHSVTFYLHT